MRQWVGPNPRFHPHAAQYDFEAWLLPFWSEIQHLAKSNRTAQWTSPEQVNHNNPPSYRINEVFRTGGSRRAYVKPRTPIGFSKARTCWSRLKPAPN